MNEWRQSTWGDEVTLEYGKPLRDYSATSGNVRVFGTSGPIGWTDTALAPGPGIVLGRKGAYRGVNYSPEPFFVIDTAYYVVPKSELEMRWLYYAIIHHQLGLIDDGSPVPSTTRAAVYPRAIVVPPPAQQRAIAGILGALDDKIGQNRRTAQALDRLARAIFRAWFVDFEPVKAKAAGATAFPSMPQPVFDALPIRFVESDIGPVPEGWDMKAIGDVVTAKGGGTPSTKNTDYWNGGEHCWATPKDMSRLAHPVLLDTERRITAAGVNAISSGVLPAGTVLMSSRAPVGYLAIAGVPTAINQGFIAMVCDGPLPATYVLNWAFASMDAIKARASGTTFAEISKTNFRPLPVVVPPPDVIAAYQRAADPLFDLVTARVKESEKLGAIRDYLLPKLLNGSVQIEANHG
jgi:type I restriction enzyme, S subunit